MGIYYGDYHGDLLYSRVFLWRGIERQVCIYVCQRHGYNDACKTVIHHYIIMYHFLNQNDFQFLDLHYLIK